MLSEPLPCDKEYAIQALTDFQEWLRARAKVFAFFTLFMEAMLAFILAQGGPLSSLAVISMVLVALLGAWTIRGNLRLARDAEALINDLRTGLVRLDKLCELPLVTAVIVHREKLYLPGRG